MHGSVRLASPNTAGRSILANGTRKSSAGSWSLYFRRSDVAEAAAILKVAPPAVMNMEGMPFVVAELAPASGDFVQALESAEKGVDSAGTDYLSLLWLGQIRASCGKLTEAEAAFRKALELEPTAPKHGWQCSVAWRSRKIEAGHLFKTGSGKVRKEDRALVLAEGNNILGHVDEAKKWYESALAERPEHIPTLRSHSLFLLRHQMPKEHRRGEEESAQDPRP